MKQIRCAKVTATSRWLWWLEGKGRVSLACCQKTSGLESIVAGIADILFYKDSRWFSEGIFNFGEEFMAVKISDKELLKVIGRYMDADKICQETDLKLKTLQARVGKLTYKNLLESPSQIKGLYKPKPKIVKMSQNAIIIPKARIEDADFKLGDMFKVTCEEDRIILSRL